MFFILKGHVYPLYVCVCVCRYVGDNFQFNVVAVDETDRVKRFYKMKMMTTLNLNDTLHHFIF